MTTTSLPTLQQPSGRIRIFLRQGETPKTGSGTARLICPIVMVGYGMMNRSPILSTTRAVQPVTNQL
ncbi:MAG: hypothetical protein P0107_08340, partial [Nitrosomonas sp.]|nr:hypothetical protein [Nitrosomonas sp.]